jgi:hypothetical protein
MSRKFNYGIRVSKQGFDVVNLNAARSQKVSQKNTLPNLLALLALPYLLGAREQVKRYKIATSTLKMKAKLGTMSCLHELSNLFEDLSTVAKYIEKCGQTNDFHNLLLNIRNHIRHDIREEYDEESDRRKNIRAQSLNIDPKLQTSIGFAIDAIKIGETVIEIQ